MLEVIADRASQLSWLRQATWNLRGILSLQATVSLAPLTWQQLAILLIGRLVLNTAFRIVYPLLTFLAAGFAVSQATISLLVTVQVAATLISPLGGRLADAYGERLTMLGGLLLFCTGTGLCAATRDFALFVLGYALIGFGTALYHPSAQAYASARTPYSRRGQVLGALELSWALAALIGVTALSWLIEIDQTWGTAFWSLFALGLLILMCTLIGLPEAPHLHKARQAEQRLGIRAALAQPGAIAVLLLVFCTLLAAELIFVVYAAWLQADFGASDAEKTRVFGMLGFVELGGSLGSMLVVDRLGKRRTVLIGFAAVAVLQALLPLSSGRWLLFLGLFFMLDLWFEFAIVSTFPLISGIVPAARGTMLALSVAAIGLGRVVGSRVGPLLWENFGFFANGLLAGAITLLGVLICLLFVHEGEA
jgi:predicted MFS family arabinose efflux permease